MSHQVQPDTVGGAAREPGAQQGTGRQPAAFVPQTPGTAVSYPPSFHGRPVSWVAVSTIMVGFVVGGLGLVLGPTWWAFWLGVGLAAVGLLLAMATNIFDDWY